MASSRPLGYVPCLPPDDQFQQPSEFQIPNQQNRRQSEHNNEKPKLYPLLPKASQAQQSISHNNRGYVPYVSTAQGGAWLQAPPTSSATPPTSVMTPPNWSMAPPTSSLTHPMVNTNPAPGSWLQSPTSMEAPPSRYVTPPPSYEEAIGLDGTSVHMRGARQPPYQ